MFNINNCADSCKTKKFQEINFQIPNGFKPTTNIINKRDKKIRQFR
jgi:hypothetical protein